MKAVVLAAGEGTRMRPMTDEIPKPLVNVGGDPILTHCFEALLDVGIDEAIVVIGYRGDQIVTRYGDTYRDLPLVYARQVERDGLATAVLAAEGHVETDFLVVNGDNVYAGNLGAVVDRHATTDADITFPVEEVSSETATTGAVCELTDDGRVTGLVEKPVDPPSQLAPAAAYVLPPAIFAACRLIQPSERGEYELPDAIDLLIHAGYHAETVRFDGWRININTPADVDRAERKLTREHE